MKWIRVWLEKTLNHKTSEMLSHTRLCYAIYSEEESSSIPWPQTIPTTFCSSDRHWKKTTRSVCGKLASSCTEVVFLCVFRSCFSHSFFKCCEKLQPTTPKPIITKLVPHQLCMKSLSLRLCCVYHNNCLISSSHSRRGTLWEKILEWNGEREREGKINLNK